MRLCHSRMPFVRAYPRENQEMVFDAHDRAFAFFSLATSAARSRLPLLIALTLSVVIALEVAPRRGCGYAPGRRGRLRAFAGTAGAA